MTPQNLKCRPTANKAGQDVNFKTDAVAGFPPWFSLAIYISGLTILIAVPIQHYFF